MRARPSAHQVDSILDEVGVGAGKDEERSGEQVVWICRSRRCEKSADLRTSGAGEEVRAAVGQLAELNDGGTGRNLEVGQELGTVHQCQLQLGVLVRFETGHDATVGSEDVLLAAGR